jgi:hypothetical protein
MAHHSTSIARGGWRVERLVRTRQAKRASSVVTDEGPGMLVSPAFWLGGLFSIGVWTALAWALTR